MFVSSLAILALATGLDLGSNHPKLQSDYYQAATRALEERKPMAVFIGRGADTFKRMLTDGAISADAAKVLTASYICLYVDTDTASGKELAGRFDMNIGVVISGPGGNLQAYRHTGAVPGEALTKELAHYASAGQPATTVTAGAAASPRYISGGCASGNCQYAVPASASYPFGSSCPNGRCPNQR
jgi:hypothetical protein